MKRKKTYNILKNSLLGTRVDLLEHLQNALDDHLHKDILSDGTEPTLQDPNFPSLQDQSQLWSLNKEQHNAFLLMGAAMFAVLPQPLYVLLLV